jgi:hypothetical protein
MKIDYTYHFINGERLSISIEEFEYNLLKEFDRVVSRGSVANVGVRGHRLRIVTGAS